MAIPRILLASLCLNEMEWLDLLHRQHINWPGLVAWVFVEATDIAYKQANPSMVSPSNLSVDGTTEFLKHLSTTDPRIRYIQHGLSSHPLGIAQGKITARNRYLEIADEVRPDYIIILDCDEFYPTASQHRVNEILGSDRGHSGYCFLQREIWRPPAISHLFLLSYEVIGGLWKGHHCHAWRYRRGMRYVSTHVWPTTMSGELMNSRMARFDLQPWTPQWLHLGWASSKTSRAAKIAYYRQRGETVTRHKEMSCRHAWQEWKPETLLPQGAQVIPYKGPIPEVFQS